MLEIEMTSQIQVPVCKGKNIFKCACSPTDSIIVILLLFVQWCPRQIKETAFAVLSYPVTSQSQSEN